MTTGRFFGLLLLAALMAALGYGASYWYRYPFGQGTSQDEPEVDLPQEPQTEIQAQGRLEPEVGTISVSALPGEQIVEILVQVGQDVAEEQELVVLGSAKIREAEHALAIAQREKAERQRDSELALSEERIKAAALAEKQARARDKELPPEELKRVTEERRTLAFNQWQALQKLHKNPATRDAISAAEVEQQRLLVQQLDAEMLHSQKKVDAASLTQDLAVEAAELESKIARLGKDGIGKAYPGEVLDKTAGLAELTKKATKVLAPSKGKILEIYARKGERVANTPILLMGNLDTMICVAEVHEANLKDIAIKEEQGRLIPDGEYPVTIKSVALQQELKGRLIEIGRLIGAPKLRDPNPLARSNRRTAQVRIMLYGQSNEIAKKFVHLQVNVTIHLK